jgi:imidazolonepropionase-like amidohydrolase
MDPKGTGMNKTLASAFIGALLVGITTIGQNQPGTSRSLVVNHVTVVNPTDSAPVNDMAIVINGTRITAVERADSVRIPPESVVIDGRGKFAIPGLADVHNHLGSGGPTVALEDLKPNLQQLLAWGVTTAFTMSIDANSFGELKRVASDDAAAYPHFYGVGPGFATFGGFRPNTPEEARTLVRRQKSDNVDAVKIAYDDMTWAVRQPIPMLKPELMAAIIDEAHQQRLKVYVHAPLLRYAKEVLRAGADGLIHGIISDPVDDEFLGLMKKNNAVYVSTLTLFEACADMTAWTQRLSEFDDVGKARPVWQAWKNPAALRQFQALYNGTAYVTQRMPIVRDNLKKVSGSGIPIVLGTDTGFPGVVLGVSTPMEVVLHVEAGLRSQDALRAATINAATMIGREKDLGTIEAGKLADLLILDANPLAEISNIKKINRVIKGGAVVPSNSAGR